MMNQFDETPAWEWVALHMMEGRGLSAQGALRMFGVGDLREVIEQLRAVGYVIDDETKQDAVGRRRTFWTMDVVESARRPQVRRMLSEAMADAERWARVPALMRLAYDNPALARATVALNRRHRCLQNLSPERRDDMQRAMVAELYRSGGCKYIDSAMKLRENLARTADMKARKAEKDASLG